jgi:hypothetical protein
MNLLDREPAVSSYVICIGNSDDKLNQQDWAAYQYHFRDLVSAAAKQIHGQWYSEPTSPWQNAAICAEIDDVDMDIFRKELSRLVRMYAQESIALMKTTTEFVRA